MANPQHELLDVSWSDPTDEEVQRAVREMREARERVLRDQRFIASDRFATETNFVKVYTQILLEQDQLAFDRWTTLVLDFRMQQDYRKAHPEEDNG